MTPNQLQSYLATMIEQRIKLSVMIWGAPGIGKSSVVRSIATEQGVDFIDMRLSQLAPTDIRGLPVPKDDRSVWLPPEFLPHEGQGILFLDEINMAPPALQGVAQQLILDRTVGSYTVPDQWYIWAAGNRKEDKAAVFDMPAPLANRFIHLDVDISIDDFRLYAFRHKFEQSIIGFLAFRSQLLHHHDHNAYAWPSPRSWEMANNLLQANLDIAPAVGDAAAAEFYAFCDVMDKLPNIQAIINNSGVPDFPKEPSQRYATIMAIISQSESVEHFVNGFKWLIDKAQAEWVQLYASDIFPLLRDRKLFAEFQQQALADDNMKNFLTDFALMLTT